MSTASARTAHRGTGQRLGRMAWASAADSRSSVTRFRLDPGARRLDTQGSPGSVVVGGSPLVVLRLTPAGARLLDRIEAGDDLVDLAPGTPAAALLERLIDRGVCHPEPEPGSGPSAVDVTVVVPVHDRPDGLARTLLALAATAPGVAGVIVVDDGSRDADTPRRVVAGTAADSPWPVQLVRRDRNRGPGAARNTGAAGVDTPVIAFVDAGCEPQPGWLDVLLPHLADPRVALVAPRVVGAVGPSRPSDGGSRHARHRPAAVVRYEAARSSLDLGPDPAPVRPRSKVPYVPSATVLVRATALVGVGGFAPELRFGEDVDLVWRFVEAGHRVRYEPRAQVAHDHPTSLRAWTARRIDYGASAAPLAIRHPGALAPLGISGWSAAVWVLAAAGRPLASASIAAGTAAHLARTLQRRGLTRPGREAAQLAGRGHLGAGRLTASAALRAWLPLALGGAVVSRRARRAVVAAAVVPPLVGWWRERPAGLHPATFVSLATLDDAAYGLGVWKGVVAERTLDPVVPSFTNWKA